MKQNLLCFLTIFLIGSSAGLHAQEVTGPLITFDKYVCNNGDVKYGSDVKWEFEIRNSGTEPLILSRVVGSGGHAVVWSWPKQPIPPGAIGCISVYYDTKRPGPIHKTITIESNSVNGTEVVTIKGQILPPEVKFESDAIQAPVND